MNREITLGKLIAILLPIFIVFLGWQKVHEERQDKKLSSLSESKVEHAQRIKALESFKEDIKVYQTKQDSNHIETLEAIGGLTTSIGVLAERVESIKK